VNDSSRPAHNPWVSVAIVCLAQLMVVLDATVVNVALPSIQHGLHLSQDNLQWVVNAYTLTFGGFLLLGGRLADLFGRRRLFFIGVSLFTAASLVNGLASSSAMLVASRAAQGIGAALCECFAAAGAKAVIAADLNEAGAQAVAARIGGAAMPTGSSPVVTRDMS